MRNSASALRTSCGGADVRHPVRHVGTDLGRWRPFRGPRGLGGQTRLADVHQVDDEDQGLAALDDATRSPAAVTEVRRNRQPSATTDAHAGDTLVPTLDHLAGTETEVERVAPVPAGVELLAVAPGATRVVDEDSLADNGLLAVADHLVFDDQVAGWIVVGD